MAIIFKWNEKKDAHPTFGDIREDEYFLYNEDLFVKINPVYAADEIESEIDNCHDLHETYDIDSTRYNCYCVNDPCYLYLEDTDLVEKVDVEISVTPKGGKA